MPAISQAATFEYKLYLDTDNNTATGCSVAVTEAGYSGTLNGIEQAITLIAQNTTLPVSVTGITRAGCTGGVFGAPVAVSPGGWSVLPGGGLNGADAIEGFVPLSSLGANGQVRIYMSANLSGQSVADVILSQNGTPAGIPILAALTNGLSASIPALNPGALALLALAIAALSHRRLRRHLPPLAAVTLAVTLGLAGGKSAEAVLATITPDGNITDWSGIAPAAQDPLGDTANGNPANDLAALYLASSAANLYFRVDVVGITNHAPTANDFAYGSNIDNAAKTFDWKALSAAVDADGDTLTATVQAQGAKGTFGVAGDNLTYTPGASQTGSDSGTLRIADGRGGSEDITVTVNGIDTTAPTTSAGPSVFGTTDTATTLSATIDENGTGYYLVQAFAAAAPNVAAVQAGTSFAMTANVAATPAIGGLSASTAYKIYFVAKDAANNVQAAVQSVDVTTTATPDTTPPVTTSAPAISVAATDTAASVTQTINENGTGYYLVLPAADAIPTVAAVKAGTSFAMTANTPAAVSLTGLTPSTAYKYYFVAKDAANNDQAAVSVGLAITTTATPDTTAPTTSAGPSVSGTTETGTTLSVTINENGTGYYLVQAFAAAAPNVAAVQAGTSFAMTANVAATPAIGGLTAGTAYKIYFVAKDAANNVQAAVQSVAVTTNTAPTANNFTYGTNIDNTAKTFDWKVLSAAADADGDTLTATVQAQGAKGAFVVAGDNVTYTPSANQTASDSGTLRISDGRGGVKDITVTVNGIDTAPPAAPTGLVLDGGAASTTAGSVALNNFTDPADADLAAWFVSESGSAPVAGDAGWSSTKPTTFTFATATNETKTVCVYVKDTLGNVQPTGACDTIDKVP